MKGIHDMVRKSKNARNEKLKKIIELLKFILPLDDEEITRSTIEAVIELLEEEIE